jgi:hypothetical protein
MPGSMVKNLQKLDRFDTYKEAKQRVKTLRDEKASDDLSLYKIIFAETELEADEQLQEKRDAPIIQEWEK